jgi:hypothetical protein
MASSFFRLVGVIATLGSLCDSSPTVCSSIAACLPGRGG